MSDRRDHDLIAKKTVVSVGYVQKFDSKSMKKIAECSDPSETGLSRSSVLTPISVDKKTVLHKNSAERPTSEVSSQYLVRVVPWRRNKDSCRIQVQSKPHVFLELYTAEVWMCHAQGTYVWTGRDSSKSKTTCDFPTCKTNPD